MRFLESIDVSASGMTAQRLRMDTISSNMANVETTRTANGTGPYRRQIVIFEARNEAPAKSKFRAMLEKEQKNSNPAYGVRVKEIRQLNENEAPFRRVYEPSHPDADAQGYVNYPNVNIVEEMTNMISATRAYEANARVIEASKGMALKALEIGR
ncbi:flagellar basal body rod protein FlgC [Syntrophomonas palmitatica]|uniref:flagellar basal body rod protein FlgC n=1 Tax=Syntrophomonas palmitatica TaxID=402877 RepID=UPI0006D24EB4|nr:flagellar basal body rod protein FlgC [Syntrophomonas palmitatica]